MTDRYDPFANVASRAIDEEDSEGPIMLADMLKDGLRAVAKPVILGSLGTLALAALGQIFLEIPFWWTVTGCLALMLGGAASFLNADPFDD